MEIHSKKKQNDDLPKDFLRRKYIPNLLYTVMFYSIFFSSLLFSSHLFSSHLISSLLFTSLLFTSLLYSALLYSIEYHISHRILTNFTPAIFHATLYLGLSNVFISNHISIKNCFFGIKISHTS